MIRFFLFIMFGLATAAGAQSVVPDRTIRAHTVILETDIVLRADVGNKGFARISDVVGQEARVVLYPGRPIRAQDIGPPAVVSRNQVVRLMFNENGLQILAEGRALERGAVGDRIRAMNLASRATLFGEVQDDGSLKVWP